MSSRLQQKLSAEFLATHPTAQVKKIGADNFLDIHLPFVHEKKGTHLFFNTSADKIKVGFYCRDDEFVQRVLAGSPELEPYSQGVRLKGHPAFTKVSDAVDAAIRLVDLLRHPAAMPPVQGGPNPSASVPEPEPVEDDEEEDDDVELSWLADHRGFPALSFKKSDTVSADTINAYIQRWQQPSLLYADRISIDLLYPDWLERLTTDEICPQFTNEQIDKIVEKIENEKIIPVLSYAPSELLGHVKQVWWIIPFCIWKEDIAAMVFIDKNGFYSWVPTEDGSECRMIFSWDKVHELELEYEYHDDIAEDELNVNRLIVRQENGGYLTLDEFVAKGSDGDCGSYLQVVEAIWKIRLKTIEASRGEDVWYEGVGGEGFVSIDTPMNLLESARWDEPYRPDPAAYGYGEDEVENEDQDDEPSDNSGNENTSFSFQESMAFLYIACAGADGNVSSIEHKMIMEKLEEWAQDEPFISGEQFTKLMNLWKSLSSEDEVKLVLNLAHGLKSLLPEEMLKSILSDLISVAKSQDGISDVEKRFIGLLFQTWGFK